MDDDDNEPKRATKRLTSPERFEAQQLIASGVLDVRDYPQFDAEAGGMLATALEGDDDAQLAVLAELFGVQMMGDYPLLAAVERRRLELLPGTAEPGGRRALGACSARAWRVLGARRRDRGVADRGEAGRERLGAAGGEAA